MNKEPLAFTYNMHKRKEMAAEQQMRKAVRDILDDMMQTIVVEVALKLGVAMHAQENAIKNIVDQYLGNNPVVNDRVENVQSGAVNIVKQEIQKAVKELQKTLPAEVFAQVVHEARTKLSLDMEKVEQRIDQVRAANGANSEVADRLREEVDQLQKVSDSLPVDLETTATAVKATAAAYTDQYCAKKTDELTEGVIKDNRDKIEKLTEALEALQAKVDTDLKVTNEEQEVQLMKLEMALKKKKDKGC